MSSMRDDVHEVVNLVTALVRDSVKGDKNADWHIDQMKRLGIIKCTEALPEQYKYMIDQMTAATARLKEATTKCSSQYDFMNHTPFDEIAKALKESLFSTSFSDNNCVDVEYMFSKLTEVYTGYIDLLGRFANFVADNILLLQALEIQLGVVGMHCPTSPTKYAGFKAHVVLHVGNPEFGEDMRKAVESEEQRREEDSADVREG